VKGRRFTSQEKEGCLERVLRVLLIAHDAATDREYHGPVPPHERCERRLVGFGHERAKEVAVTRATRDPFGEPANVAEDGIESCSGHDRCFLTSRVLYLQMSGHGKTFALAIGFFQPAP
jgi:hypothetical protein